MSGSTSICPEAIVTRSPFTSRTMQATVIPCEVDRRVLDVEPERVELGRGALDQVEELAAVLCP